VALAAPRGPSRDRFEPDPPGTRLAEADTATREAPRPPDDADARRSIQVNNAYQNALFLNQQITVLQYIQLALPTAFGGQAFARTDPRALAPRTTRFPTSLTNPDNPWGFNFSPPVLVK
jgi:hypothetical protein